MRMLALAAAMRCGQCIAGYVRHAASGQEAQTRPGTPPGILRTHVTYTGTGTCTLNRSRIQWLCIDEMCVLHASG